MWRLLIIVSVTPFIVGGIFANIFGVRILSNAPDLSVTVRSLIEKLLRSIGREDIDLVFTKGTPWADFESNRIALPRSYEGSKKANHAARACLKLGMLLLHEKHPSPVAWRLKAVKLGYILPIFTLLIVLFSFVVGKLPGVIFLAAIALSLGVSTLMLWLSMSVEKEAAHLMVGRIEKLRILPRLRDEETLVSAVRAIPWASLIPGALLKLIVKG